MNYKFTEVDFENTSPLFKLEDALKGFLGFLLYNPFISLFNLEGDEDVLDFGCGGGAGAQYIAKKLNYNGSITCTDLSEYWINQAQKRLSRYKNVRCLQGDIRKLNIPDNAFDVISIVHVIHDIHPEQRESTVHSLAKKLRNSGRLFIYEPTRPSHGIAIEEIRTHMDKAGLKESRCIIKKSRYIGEYKREP